MNCTKCKHVTGWGDDEHCSLSQCAYVRRAAKTPESYNFRAEQFGAYRHGLKRLNEVLPEQKKQIINAFRKMSHNDIYVKQHGTGGWKFADLAFEAMYTAGKTTTCSSVCDYEGRCPKCCKLPRCDKPDGWRCTDCR